VLLARHWDLIADNLEFDGLISLCTKLMKPKNFDASFASGNLRSNYFPYGASLSGQIILNYG
jgi:hypothetical protein